MKRLTTLLALAVAATLVAGAVDANAATPRIHRREFRQHERIRQGVRSGELTRGETRHLRAGQLRVHRMEYRAHADGRMTPRERMRIHRMQDRQSRAIYRLKHNRRRV